MTRRDALFSMVPMFVLLGTVLILVLGWMCLMPHGTPDWYDTGPTTTIHRVTDLGELAARLGSVDTFDRRGDVIWLSGFENGLGECSATSSGAGGAVGLSTSQVLSGAYAVKLTAGSDGSKMAAAWKRWPYPALSRFGYEAAYTWNTGLSHVQQEMVLLDGSTWTRWILKLSQADRKVYYYNVGGGWTELGDLPGWLTETNLFHVVKLVGNLETKKYERCLIDNVGYSMAGIDAYQGVSLVAPEMDFNLTVYGPGGSNPSIYTDNWILTQNEP